LGGKSNNSTFTVSRQLGSLEDEIAKATADELNYDCIDKKRIGEAFAAYGLRAPEFEKYDEKKHSFWQSFSQDKKRIINF